MNQTANLFPQVKITSRGPMLAGGFVVLVSLWQLSTVFVWRPLQTQRLQLRSAQQKLTDARQIYAKGAAAEAYCERHTAQSLSSDPSIVSHMYQEWLLKQAQSMPAVSVGPSVPIDLGELGYRVSFNVEGEADTHWLATLVDDLNRLPLMHRISYLNLQRDAKRSEQQVHFALTLDALALKGTTQDGQWPGLQLDTDGSTLAKFLSTKQPFKRGYLGPPAPQQTLVRQQPPAKPAIGKPAIDPLRTFKLIASVAVNGTPQAWLVDSRTEQEIFVAESETFSFATIEAEVTKINADYVELRTGNKLHRWPLGATLREVLN